MNNDTFRSEYMADFPVETREDRRALELWCWYRVETEAFDRRACTGRDEIGITIPRVYYERVACSQNAARTYLAMTEQAEREDISADAMMRAKRRAERMSFEEQQRVARLVAEDEC